MFKNHLKLATTSLVGVVGLGIGLLGVPEAAKAANFSGSFITDESTVPVKTSVFNKYDANGDEIFTGTFDTEMQEIQFDIDIPDLGTVIIREDPNKTSTGQTTVTDIGAGEYQIDSFFDIYSQISLDGGKTWLMSVDENGDSAPMRVTLAEVPNPAPNQLGCITNSPLLPPNRCGYWSQFHSWFWLLDIQTGKLVSTIHLSNVWHFGFLAPPIIIDGPPGLWEDIPRMPFPDPADPDGPNIHEMENFVSTVQGDIEVTMVPEPSTTLGLIALGIGGLFGIKRKKDQK